MRRREVRRVDNSHMKSISDTSRSQKMATSFAKKINFSALILLAILSGLWYFGAHFYDKTFIFPYFEDVVGEIVYALTDLAVLRAIAITLRRVLLGTLYGVLVGVPLGMAMGFSPFVMKTLAPYVNALRQIPTTAWVPLAIIWFGLGDGPTLFVIALHGVFIVILNTAGGVMDINPEYYHAVRSMGASTADVVKDVVLPGSLPGVITGVRLALGLGWMTVV